MHVWLSDGSDSFRKIGLLQSFLLRMCLSGSRLFDDAAFDDADEEAGAPSTADALADDCAGDCDTGSEPPG